jgi:hypothetical protein
MGIIAPKGSGKTTLIVNLLKFYKNYFHSIVIFSPTIESDEKWDYAKELDLICDNIPLKSWIKSLRDKEKTTDIVARSNTGDIPELSDGLGPLLDKRIPEENFHLDYDEEFLKSIVAEQMDFVKVLKKHGKSKHLANRVLFIMDDLVGSTLFTNARQNTFKGLNTRHRHASASIIMVTQAYKEIPKTIRTNFSCLIVFEIPNDKELEVIYEENSLYMKRKDWLEAYEFCVAGDHDFMFINYQKQKRLRLMKNFDQVVFVDN